MFHSSKLSEYTSCRSQQCHLHQARAPLNEIWISEKWKPYAKYIIFHELREIYYRAKGFERDDAHEKAIEDQLALWKDDRLFLKMVRHMQETDRKTAEKKRMLKSLK